MGSAEEVGVAWHGLGGSTGGWMGEGILGRGNIMRTWKYMVSGLVWLELRVQQGEP